MISLKTYREYYEDVMRRVPGIHSVRVVNVDQDMSDCLKSISSDELPVLFVVVPSAQETGTDPDNVEEDNLCLIFLYGYAAPWSGSGAGRYTAPCREHQECDAW